MVFLGFIREMVGVSVLQSFFYRCNFSQVGSVEQVCDYCCWSYWCFILFCVKVEALLVYLAAITHEFAAGNALCETVVPGC